MIIRSSGVGERKGFKFKVANDKPVTVGILEILIIL